jgi:hypothetical protein
VQFSVFDTQGNPNAWSPATAQLNGHAVLTQLNREADHTSTTPHVDLANSALAFSAGPLRIAFASPDSGGDQRTLRVTVKSVQFLDHAGQPIAGFSYTTDSGNAYPVAAGKFVATAGSAGA